VLGELGNFNFDTRSLISTDDEHEKIVKEIQNIDAQEFKDDNFDQTSVYTPSVTNTTGTNNTKKKGRPNKSKKLKEEKETNLDLNLDED
jgi:hypothetical protein